MGKKMKINIKLMIAIIFFSLYVIAIGLPVIFLAVRITSVKELCNANCYAIENSMTPDGDNILQPKNLFNYLNSSEAKLYTMFSYLSNIDSDGTSITQSYANESFFELYDLELEAGRKFRKSDFKYEEDDVVPIIVGFDVQDQYKLGHTYDIRTFGSADIFKAEVVGVLAEDISYIAHWLEKKELNDFCIIPISEGFAEKYFVYPDYHMFFSRTVIDTDDVAKIAVEINRNGLDLELVPMNSVISKQMNGFLIVFGKRLMIGIVLFICILSILLVRKWIISYRQKKKL